MCSPKKQKEKKKRNHHLGAPLATVLPTPCPLECSGFLRKKEDDQEAPKPGGGDPRSANKGSQQEGVLSTELQWGGPRGTCPQNGLLGPAPFPAPTPSLCFLSLLFPLLTHNKNIIMGFILKKRQIMVTCFNYLPSNGGLNYTGRASEVT